MVDFNLSRRQVALWLVSGISSGILLLGCSKDIPAAPDAITYPAHFPPIAYPNNENKPTQDGIALGRTLFYDKQLSLSGTISCGSCHSQIHGFADHNTLVSTGIFNRKGQRNAPPLFNLAWQTNFMWDGGVNHLDVLPLAPLTDTNEMGLPINQWINKVREQPRYRPLFSKVYGSDSITEKRTLLALSQFMLSLISSRSKYDEVLLQRATFSPSEAEGYRLFKTHCNQCHTEPLFTNNQYERNGATTSGADRGRMRITEMPEDLYKFKVPSLRNISLTYPYMHNGKIQNLDAVLTHYQKTLLDGSLEKMQTGQLSDTDKQAMIDFLLTLTDPIFISNHAFSEP
ncbi:MAG: hypothetical protein RL003_294 [Bacteroidota bacterium]|jgi:cytochrome c peroxidase